MSMSCTFRLSKSFDCSVKSTNPSRPLAHSWAESVTSNSWEAAMLVLKPRLTSLLVTTDLVSNFPGLTELRQMMCSCGPQSYRMGWSSQH
jgi:hypothetical protein